MQLAYVALSDLRRPVSDFFIFEYFLIFQVVIGSAMIGRQPQGNPVSDESDSSLREKVSVAVLKAFGWLGVAVPRKQREKQEDEHEEEEEQRKKRAQKKQKAGSGNDAGDKQAANAKATITVGGESATVELGSSGDGGGGDEPPDEGDTDTGDTRALVLKVAGAIAAGIGVAGAVTVVGASVLWIRFGEAGLPATQAVSVVPRDQLLVQGAQQAIVFVLIALAAVVFIGMCDPKGYVTRGTVIGLGILVVGACFYAALTKVGCLDKLLLFALALLLAGGCVRIAISTDDRFWPLAVSVFFAALVFSSACGYLAVKQQDFVQAIAVLRSPTDKGLTGVFVAATEKTIYLGQPLTAGEGERIGPDLYEVANSEKVTYAVGPLQDLQEATVRARVMLAQLIENRNQDPAPPAPPEEKEGSADAGAATTAGDVAGGAEDATPPSAPVTGSATTAGSASTNALGPEVFDAFSGPIVVHLKVGAKPLCMVRYADRTNEELSGHWWTTCPNANRLEAILDAKDNLALPARFQAVYDMRVEASIPPGKRFTYLAGTTAPQCEHEPPLACGYEFPGGGIQYYVPDPATVLPWIREPECTVARQDATSNWQECTASAGE